MTTLLEYLLARQIARDALVKAGIAEARVNELYDDSEPTIDEIRKISRTFKVSARDLIVPINKNLGKIVKLRSNFNYNHDEFSFYEACMIENRLSEITSSIELNSELPFFVEYPKTYESAETLSRIFRSEIIKVDLFGPLVQLPEILFEFFQVLTFTFSARKVDGASLRRGRSAIIAIAERNDIRMLYTAAHELCHLLVDIADGHNNEAWIDEDVFAGNEATVRETEFFANAFAASLLIPLEGLFEEIRAAGKKIGQPSQLTAYHIACIARRYGTSFRVAALRCENLGLLDGGGAVALEMAVRKEYKSVEKYADITEIPQRKSVDWSHPARKVVQRLEPLFRDGTLSWTKVHELLNLKIN